MTGGLVQEEQAGWQDNESPEPQKGTTASQQAPHGPEAALQVAAAVAAHQQVPSESGRSFSPSEMHPVMDRHLLRQLPEDELDASPYIHGLYMHGTEPDAMLLAAYMPFPLPSLKLSKSRTSR